MVAMVTVVFDALMSVPAERGLPVHPSDRYYPSHYSDSLPRDRYHQGALPQRSSNLDAYATLTPSERLHGGRIDEGRWVP